MNDDLKIKIKAVVKTVKLFAFSTLLAALIMGALWGIILGVRYLVLEEIITSFTLIVVCMAIIIICAFVRIYREMYNDLKNKEKQKNRKQ